MYRFLKIQCIRGYNAHPQTLRPQAQGPGPPQPLQDLHSPKPRIQKTSGPLTSESMKSVCVCQRGKSLNNPRSYVALLIYVQERYHYPILQMGKQRLRAREGTCSLAWELEPGS